MNVRTIRRRHAARAQVTLVYCPENGLVWLKLGESEPECLGSPRDSANCPIDEYQADWDTIRAAVLTPRELWEDSQ